MNLLSQTAQFSDWFSKFNELITKVNELEFNIGTLSNLDTLDKSSLVTAINEKSPSIAMSLILEE